VQGLSLYVGVTMDKLRALADSELVTDSPREDDLSQVINELELGEFGGGGHKMQIPATTVQTVQVVKPASVAHFHCPNTLPLPNMWPDRPLLVRESVLHGTTRTSEKPPISLASPLPFDFTTSLFQGQMFLRYNSDRQPASAPYFQGKKRLQSVVITGRFKREVPFADLLTGQEFCHNIKSPGAILSKALLGAIKVLAPLLNCRIAPPGDPDHSSYFVSPLAQTVQKLRVSEEPFPLSAAVDVEEDTRLLGGKLADKPMDDKERRKFFASKSNLAAYSFGTELYYTFDFYNDKIDFESWEFALLGKKFALERYLLGQPVRVLARAGESAEYAWNFEVWHEKQTHTLATAD